MSCPTVHSVANLSPWLSVRAQDSDPKGTLYTEGWPDKQRTGRKVGRQAVTIRWQEGRLTVVENGAVLWQTEWPGFAFPAAYLYLQMSSHSNYPPREVFFDDLSFRPAVGAKGALPEGK